MGRIVYVQNRKGVKITHITHKWLFSPPVFIKGGEKIGVRIALYVIENPLNTPGFIGGVFVRVKISLTALDRFLLAEEKHTAMIKQIFSMHRHHFDTKDAAIKKLFHQEFHS